MPISIERINRARSVGYSDDEIVDYIAEKDPEYAPKIKQAREYKYESKEILGSIEKRLSQPKQSNANVNPVYTNQDQSNVNQVYKDDKVGVPPQKNPEYWHKFQHGLRESASGELAQATKLFETPENQKAIAEDETFGEGLVRFAGEVGGDFPYIAAGFTLGTAVGTVAGGPIGGLVGGAAGSLAFPKFIKEALKEYKDYTKLGNDLTFGEFLDRADRVASKTLKEGAFGVILGQVKNAMPLLRKVPMLDKMFSTKIGEKAGTIAAETAVAATVPPITEGRLPQGQDFAHAAAQILGLNLAHASVKAITSLNQKIKASGKTPEQYAHEHRDEIASLVEQATEKNFPPNKAAESEAMEKAEVKGTREAIAKKESEAMEKSSKEVTPKESKEDRSAREVREKITEKEKKAKEVRNTHFTAKEKLRESTEDLKQAKDAIEEMSPSNQKSLARRAYEQGRIRNKEQFDSFLEQYDLLHHRLPGKNQNAKNRQFLKKFEEVFQKPVQKLVGGSSRQELREMSRKKQEPQRIESEEKELHSTETNPAEKKAEKSEPVKPENPKEGQEFTTAKGSTYIFHPDGTTTRNKAARTEHPGEEGIQPKSKRTWFLSEAQANKLSVYNTQGPGKRIIEHENGDIAVQYTSGPNKGKIIESSIVTPMKKPKVGTYPLEYFGPDKTAHFGNKITDTESPQIAQLEQQLKKAEAKGDTKRVSVIRKNLAIFKTKVKKNQAKKKTPKPKKPKEPITVPIPAEDVGKSSREILEKHVVHKIKSKRYIPTIEEGIDVLNTKLHREYAPLDKLEHGDYSILSHPGKLAEIFKGWIGKAESVLRFADYDAETGRYIGPGFQMIFNKKRLKQITGKSKLDREALDYYLASQTSLERQNLGQKSAIPTETAKQFIKENPQFEEISKEIIAYGKNRLANLRKSGFISEKNETIMNKMYKDHVPLYRMMPIEQTLFERIKNGVPGLKNNKLPGNSSLRTKQQIHKAEGSERQILSPTESIVKNTLMFEQAIAKNRVLNSTSKGITEKLGYAAKEVGRSKISKEKLQEMVGDEFTIEDDMVDAFNQAYDLANIGGDVKRGTFRYFENGKLMEIEAPKEIIEALDGLSPQQSNILIEIASRWKNVFSQGVVLQPGTMARLTGMDLIVSSLQSRYPTMGIANIPVNVFYNFPRMLFDIAKRGDLFKDYMLSGASQSSMRGIDRAMLESMTDTLTNADTRMKHGFKEWTKELTLAPLKIVPKILKGLAKTSEVMNDAVKMIEYEKSYKANLAKGKSHQEATAQAAFDAFEVSVPYGRKGSSGALQGIYKVAAFANTVMNSGVTVAKTLNPKTNPNFIPFVSQAVAALTIPTIAFYLKNRNDPRYQSKPQEDKDRNIYYWFTDDPNEQGLKLRKMWQYGFIFQTLPERVAEYMVENDPSAFDDLLKSFEYEFSPLTFLSFAKTFDEGFHPEKFFEGRTSFIPESQKRIDAALQHTANTTETAKIIGKYSGISPLYIDQIVSSTGGGIGQNAMRLWDEALYFTGTVDDRRPEAQTADAIFWGTFFERGPSSRSQHVIDLYALVDKMEGIKATANELKSQGREEEADKYLEGYVDTKHLRREMKQYFDEIKEIRKAPLNEIDKPEKRQKMNDIYRDMTEKAKQLVEEIEDELAEKSPQ